MINTVEKKYNLENTFNAYKVTYTIQYQYLHCTTRRSKHRLPSNSGMD
jgi:hypothetical protein